MPRDQETIQVPYKQWVELTNSDAEALTYQVLSGHIERRVGTATPPTEGTRGMALRTGQGQENASLSDMAQAGGTRVWAYGKAFSGSRVFVDHA